tara:strand:- start:408 stop:1448 length:1041 start_codon:yes stop_codon:yes gene_type:complete
MKNLVRFEVTMGRICFLALTALMTVGMFVVGFLKPGIIDAAPEPVISLEIAPPSKTKNQESSDRFTKARLENAREAKKNPGFNLSGLVSDNEDEEGIAARSVNELRSVFKKHGFTLSTCQFSGCIQVPRLELLSLPGDLKSLSPTQKKDIFLRSHLPLILQANEKILGERKRLQLIMRHQAKNHPISLDDKKWIAEMMEKYRLKKWDLDELLCRIDILPPSLALGQSAVESGWGTSFAAREKNSTFGMTVRNRVLGYETLQDCVDAYIRNINANPAYRDLREIRARLREQGQDICALTLAEGLIRYSELGRRYIVKVQNIIQSNNLKRFDTAQLMSSSVDSTFEKA